MVAMQREKPKKEFDEVLVEVRRVTRVTTGGRRMSFRATILVGNKNGKIGIGSAKGADVSIAVQKATHEAYKNVFIVPVANGNTVPYPTVRKFKSAVVKLLPASAGTGMKAGSSVRIVLELAGYENMLSKIIGSNNKLNNALATIYALAAYKHADHFKRKEKVTSAKLQIASEAAGAPVPDKIATVSALKKVGIVATKETVIPEQTIVSASKEAVALNPVEGAGKPKAESKTEENKTPVKKVTTAKKAVAKKSVAKVTPKKK